MPKPIRVRVLLQFGDRNPQPAMDILIAAPPGELLSEGQAKSEVATGLRALAGMLDDRGSWDDIVRNYGQST